MIPKISIIAPVYQVEEYLSHFIESILAQTFTDWELLLIDDGSSDNSGQICDEYALKDERINVFHKQNGGVTAARKDGVKNARSEWITFVDSDDMLYPQALTVLYSHIENVDLVNACLEDTTGRKWKHKKYGLLNQKEYIQSILNGNTYALVTACLYNKKLFSEASFAFPPDIKIGEDCLMKMQLGNQLHYAYNIPDIVYYYRINTQSVMCSKKCSVSYMIRYYKLRDSILPLQYKGYCDKKEMEEVITVFFDRNIPYRKKYYHDLMKYLAEKDSNLLCGQKTKNKLYIQILKYKPLVIFTKNLEYWGTRIIKKLLKKTIYTVID